MPFEFGDVLLLVAEDPPGKGKAGQAFGHARDAIEEPDAHTAALRECFDRLREEVVAVDDESDGGPEITESFFYKRSILLAGALAKRLLVGREFVQDLVEAIIGVDGIVVGTDLDLPPQGAKRPRDIGKEIMEIGSYEEEAVHVLNCLSVLKLWLGKYSLWDMRRSVAFLHQRVPNSPVALYMRTVHSKYIHALLASANSRNRTDES